MGEESNISSFGDLDIVIQGTSKQAVDSINKTVKALDTLENRLGSFSVGSSTTNLKSLASALAKFAAVPKPNLTKANANAIRAIAEAADAVTDGTTGKMASLAEGLRLFNEVAPDKLATSAAQFARLPKALKDIQNVDFDKMVPQIERLVQVMTPLAEVMEKIGSGFSAMPPKIKQYIKSMTDTTKETERLAKSKKGLIGWLQSTRAAYIAVAFAATKVAKLFGNMVHQSNLYIENLNLFTITMGNATQAALDYAEAIGQAVGINPAEWIKYQGIFKQIVSGFGVVDESANLMSKNLTQLVYDSASYFNTTVEESAQKFEAAMAQQSRPLRRFGYDISMTALREEALAMGIQQTVDTMSRAEKAQLTYIVLMKQSQNVMGDMARTIITPANALRIMNMQWDVTKRSLGNAIIPLIQVLVPYFVALAQAIQHVAHSLAALAGFEMPHIDYSQMNSGPVEHLEDAFNNLGDSIGGATSKVKEFKNFVMGFDELHVIPTPSSGGGGGLNELGDLFANFKLPEYDFLAQLAPRNKDIEKIRKTMIVVFEWLLGAIKTLLPFIESIGIYLVAAFAGNKVLGAINTFLTRMKFSEVGVANFVEKAKGLGMTIGGAFVSGFSGYLLGQSFTSGAITSLQSFLGGAAGAIGGGTLIAKGLSIFGVTGPIGVGLGLAAGTLATIVGWLIGAQKETARLNKEAKLDEFTGQLRLAEDEIRQLVKTLTNTDYNIRLTVFADAYADMVTIGTEVDSALAEMNKTQRLIQLGAEISVSDYKITIDNFMQSVQKYLTSQQTVLKLAVELTFGAGEEGKFRISQLGDWHQTQEAELKALEAKITKILQDNLEKGISAIETDKAIAEYIGKYNEIWTALQEFERSVEAEKVKIRLGRLTSGAEIGMSDLDLESWKSALAEIEQYIENTASSAGDSLAVLLTAAKKNFVVGSEEYKEAVAAIYQSHYTELLKQYAVTNESLYSDSLLSSAQIMSSESVRAFAENTIRYTDILDTLMGDNKRIYTDMLTNVGEATKRAAEDLYANVKGIVTVEANELALAYQSGATIPIEFMRGFREHMQVGALAGDIDATNYLIGERMTNSRSAIELLASVKGLGEKMPEYQRLGFLSKTHLTRDATGEWFANINGTFYSLTPELYQNLKDIGIHIPENLNAGILQSIPGMTYRQDLFDDLKRFAQNKGWDEIKTLLGDKGVQAITDAFDKIGKYDNYGDFIEAALQGVYTDEEISAIRTFYDQYSKELGGFFDKAKTYKGILDEIFGVTSKSIKFEFQTVSSGVKANVSVTRGMTYATGGFPTAGEFFMANEYGNVEMVGKQGTRSMVANNMQIIEGISHGVVEGMVMAAAITGDKDTSDSGDTLVIQVGGQTIYTATMAEAKRQAQRSGKAAIVVR